MGCLPNRQAEKQIGEVLSLGTGDIQEPLQGLGKGSSGIRTPATCLWALSVLENKPY